MLRRPFRSAFLPACVLIAVLGLVGACSGRGGGREPDGQTASTTTARPKVDDLVHLDELQLVGTHNSFHRRLPPELFDLLHRVDAKLADSVDYDHRSLPDQLDDGLRQLELDVWADPDGGRYATHAATKLANLPDPALPPLQEPGYKVLHVPEVDYGSSCPNLRTCLEVVRRWSDDHPRHLPIMIFVEAKDSGIPDLPGLGFATPLPIGAPELDALDEEVRSALGEERLLTPDDIRGDHATLREAVTTDGWPTLARSRGKVLLCLLNDDAKRDAYVAGHASLQGRTMFTLSGPDRPESAIVSRPDPVRQAADIERLVRQHLLVRTRADADVAEARTNTTARRDAALASAATWVSTDFPQPDPAFAGGYAVTPRFRCNPVSAPPACKDDELDP